MGGWTVPELLGSTSGQSRTLAALGAYPSPMLCVETTHELFGLRTNADTDDKRNHDAGIAGLYKP